MRSNKTKRIPDKLIDMIPHRECVYCYTFKPLKDFYVSKTTTTFGDGGLTKSPTSFKKKIRSSYCRKCDDKYIKNKHKRKPES